MSAYDTPREVRERVQAYQSAIPSVTSLNSRNTEPPPHQFGLPAVTSLNAANVNHHRQQQPQRVPLLNFDVDNSRSMNPQPYQQHQDHSTSYGNNYARQPDHHSPGHNTQAQAHDSSPVARNRNKMLGGSAMGALFGGSSETTTSSRYNNRNNNNHNNRNRNRNPPDRQYQPQRYDEPEPNNYRYQPPPDPYHANNNNNNNNHHNSMGRWSDNNQVPARPLSPAQISGTETSTVVSMGAVTAMETESSVWHCPIPNV